MSETEDKVGVAGRIKRFVGENRAGVITGAIALIVALVLFSMLVNTSVQPSVKEAPPPIQIQIQRPKPPPPPPPPPPKIQQMKQITPQKLPTPVPKPLMQSPPKAAPPKAGPPPLGTSIHNNTGDAGFGALANGGGDGVLGGSGDGGGGGSYEGSVISAIQQALQENPKTRTASGTLKVSLKISPGGKIIGVTIEVPSGNTGYDEAVQTELPGLQLPLPQDGEVVTHMELNLIAESPL